MILRLIFFSPRIIFRRSRVKGFIGEVKSWEIKHRRKYTVGYIWISVNKLFQKTQWDCYILVGYTRRRPTGWYTLIFMCTTWKWLFLTLIDLKLSEKTHVELLCGVSDV